MTRDQHGRYGEKLGGGRDTLREIRNTERKANVIVVACVVLFFVVAVFVARRKVVNSNTATFLVRPMMRIVFAPVRIASRVFGFVFRRRGGASANQRRRKHASQNMDADAKEKTIGEREPSQIIASTDTTPGEAHKGESVDKVNTGGRVGDPGTLTDVVDEESPTSEDQSAKPAGSEDGRPDKEFGKGGDEEANASTTQGTRKQSDTTVTQTQDGRGAETPDEALRAYVGGTKEMRKKELSEGAEEGFVDGFEWQDGATGADKVGEQQEKNPNEEIKVHAPEEEGTGAEGSLVTEDDTEASHVGEGDRPAPSAKDIREEEYKAEGEGFASDHDETGSVGTASYEDVPNVDHEEDQTGELAAIHAKDEEEARAATEISDADAITVDDEVDGGGREENNSDTTEEIDEAMRALEGGTKEMRERELTEGIREGNTQSEEILGNAMSTDKADYVNMNEKWPRSEKRDGTTIDDSTATEALHLAGDGTEEVETHGYVHPKNDGGADGPVGRDTIDDRNIRADQILSSSVGNDAGPEAKVEEDPQLEAGDSPNKAKDNEESLSLDRKDEEKTRERDNFTHTKAAAQVETSAHDMHGSAHEDTAKPKVVSEVKPPKKSKPSDSDITNPDGDVVVDEDSTSNRRKDLKISPTFIDALGEGKAAGESSDEDAGLGGYPTDDDYVEDLPSLANSARDEDLEEDSAAYGDFSDISSDEGISERDVSKEFDFPADEPSRHSHSVRKGNAKDGTGKVAGEGEINGLSKSQMKMDDLTGTNKGRSGFDASAVRVEHEEL
ncbi:unnamed protein product [Chondrus crispus]|uniref:Uncharacterized protein n=1 Tax=Chondrus crispus TaxID=2769 RepID=R7Q6G0_CHOCR|nr:unnamed protein product [Chondrus crispus]CDF33604.1 unnamed protein product [Chondrus crispus]|eukprot:XP_005713407.1 unnamed protein product [Chondrus crispus]